MLRYVLLGLHSRYENFGSCCRSPTDRSDWGVEYADAMIWSGDDEPFCDFSTCIRIRHPQCGRRYVLREVLVRKLDVCSV